MGQRALNPLAFTTVLPNQVDPVLNPVRSPRTGANNTADRLGAENTVRGSRNDQILINDMDNAVGGLQAEDTAIDTTRTPLVAADLQQQIGQHALAEVGTVLDLIA